MENHIECVDATPYVIFGGIGKILYMHLLKLVKEGIKRAELRQKRALKRKTEVALDDLLGVYILEVALLEAFINELCEHKISKEQKGNPYWLDSLKRITKNNIPLKQKWQLVPQLLWQRKFDEDQEPWKSFRALIKLRNELIHYKMELLPPEGLPKGLGHIKHLLLDQTEFRPKPWIDRICSLELAKWAYNTGVSMIMRLLELADSETRECYTGRINKNGIKRID